LFGIIASKYSHPSVSAKLSLPNICARSLPNSFLLRNHFFQPEKNELFFLPLEIAVCSNQKKRFAQFLEISFQRET
jgi:hypothetical protein